MADARVSRWKRRRSRQAGLSIEGLDDLVRLMDENLLTEVTVQDGNRTLALKRSTAEGAGDTEGEGTERHPDAEDGLAAITSPTVGIFYGSPVPGQPPFVEEGQIIEPGQVVALIETLKVMSEVRSDVCGRVISIEARDGELVEFGKTLILCQEMI